MDSEGKYAPRVSKFRDLVHIEGDPRGTKDKFFELMEKEVHLVDGEQFRERFFPQRIAAVSGGAVYKFSPSSKTIKGWEIFINKDDLMIDGEDYSDLIPIFARHEIAELWYFAKTGYSMGPPPKGIGEEEAFRLAHAMAVREGWRYAFEQGKEERFMEFLTKYHEQVAPSEEYLRENIATYKTMKKTNAAKESA